MTTEPRQLLEDFADTCIQCGLCARTDCGNYAPGTPNLGEIAQSLLDGDETWRHFPYTCALCNRCTVRCPAKLHASDMCKPARGVILSKHEELRPLYRKFRTDKKWNLLSALKAKTDGDINKVTYIEGEADLGGDADHTAFFPGCALYAYQPELTAKVAAWLREEKFAAFTLYVCCGATFYDSGFYEEFEEYRKRAQAYFAEQGIERLVIVCPHCSHILPELVEGTGIEIVLLSELLEQRGKRCEEELNLSFHDSCYDRDAGVFGSLARGLYPNSRVTEMEHCKKDCLCCGGGGMVSVYAPAFCEYRRNLRLAEIDEVEADTVVSTCFSCVNSMQRGNSVTAVKHFLEPIFGVETDWAQVYARVDALYADPAYEELCTRDDPAFS